MAFDCRAIEDVIEAHRSRILGLTEASKSHAKGGRKWESLHALREALELWGILQDLRQQHG